ncbi:MAG TPA: hypothetical protein VL793_01125 [Patescibacteria group bacterium]|nr:hypothetical protein [Patescibacteria group bacterium]
MASSMHAVSSVMPSAEPKPELMQSLGRLVRGLSALFWGLPASLVICFRTARADSLKNFGIIPPILCTGLILYGVWQMTAFQKQERVWRSALDRALWLSMVNLGLSPFLFWWNKMPGNLFFTGMVLLMIITGLLFLASLNSVLRRLGAMLPDEALRLETRHFTALNLNLIWATFLLCAMYLALGQFRSPPLYLQAIKLVLDRGSFWFLVLLVLLPLAMTMALLWKTKEVILDNVFGTKVSGD